MATELKVLQMTIDGLPYLCPECDTASFTLDGRGFSDRFPARGNCSNYHSWESLFLTIGDLKQIQAASTGRQRAEDVDTFEIEVGGAILAGILHPDVIVDDVKRAVRDVYWKRLIKPALRKQKRKALRAAKKPVSNAVASAKAAAIGAAWGLQAGGHDPDPDYTPEPVNACPFCDNGYINLDTHIHNAAPIRCTVCVGTGEID